MTSISSANRERQRVEHLVLARGRPEPDLPPKPKGVLKAEWKVMRAAMLAAGATLLPGIEERVALRERWSHKQGTPETHEHLDQAQSRPGSLARLYASGVIDDDQLAASDGIAESYRLITACVAIRTASFEARVDSAAHGRAEQIQLGRVLADLTYSHWRSAVGTDIDALLEVIVHDIGLTIVARRRRMSMPRARRMLVAGLDQWHASRGSMRRDAIALCGLGPIPSDTIQT